MPLSDDDKTQAHALLCRAYALLWHAPPTAPAVQEAAHIAATIADDLQLIWAEGDGSGDLTLRIRERQLRAVDNHRTARTYSRA
jgi:hypothetical protein